MEGTWGMWAFGSGSFKKSRTPITQGQRYNSKPPSKVCQGLGNMMNIEGKGDTFIFENDRMQEGLDNLVRYLEEESADDKLTTNILCEQNVVDKHLIPILRHVDDKETSVKVMKLLMLLTTPIVKRSLFQTSYLFDNDTNMDDVQTRSTVWAMHCVVRVFTYCRGM